MRDPTTSVEALAHCKAVLYVSLSTRENVFLPQVQGRS